MINTINQYRKTLYVITLLLFSAGIPELLTGSTPYWSFLNPVNMLILIVIYGFPTLLYREYVIRRDQSYTRLLLFGLAQGVLIEGIAVNTFYSTQPSLGVFSEYGRFIGVNWPWSVYLVLFHSVWSVYVPVTITEIIFGSERRSPMIDLNTRNILLLSIPVIFVIYLFRISESTYKPSPLYTLASIIVFIAIISLAAKMTSPLRPIVSRKLVYPQSVLFMVLYPILFLLVEFFILPKIIHPIIHIFLGIITYLALYNRLAVSNQIKQYIYSLCLLLGLSILGVFVAVLDNKLYIIYPAILFIALSTLLLKRMKY